MAEVEETREFEQLVPSVSEAPPPPYEERSPPGNEETTTQSVCRSVATPLTPSLGVTEPQLMQLYQGNLVASRDYYFLTQCVGILCGILCICSIPWSLAAMMLVQKVRMHSIHTVTIEH
jgi:hypothetical protein